MLDDYNYYPPLSEVKCQPLDEEGRTRFERMVDEQIERDKEIGEAVDYIMNRLEIMRYRSWAYRLEPSSCGYRKPESYDGSFKPTDRNSKSWNGTHKRRHPSWPKTMVTM